MRQRTVGADCAIAGADTAARPAPAAPAALLMKRRRCMSSSLALAADRTRIARDPERADSDVGIDEHRRRPRMHIPKLFREAARASALVDTQCTDRLCELSTTPGP